MGSSHLEKIETLLQSNATTREPELKVALTRLSAEIKNRLKKGAPTSVDFFSATLRALSRLKGMAHAEIRMTCIYDSVFFLYTNGYSVAALEAVHQLNSLANRARIKAWVRKTENLGGMVHADLGNVADAVVSYATALSIAREIGNAPGEISVLINLGVALNYGGLYREAIPCFERVTTLLQTDYVVRAISNAGPVTAEFGPAALANMAQSYFSLGELSKGFRAICESLEKCTEPSDATFATSRAIREFTFVQIALELGKLDLARAHSKACDTYGQVSGRRGRFLADIARGLCEVHGGDVDSGLSLLEAALASSSGTGSFRVDALTALVKAYDQVGRPEHALECMKELLEQIRSAREKGILAIVSLPLTGTSGSQLPAESEDLRALTHKEAQLRAKVAENDALNSRIEMLERLAVTADLKEESSGEHGYRVGKLSSVLAEELNWSRDACFAIDLAARLHDIGKIGVPDRILLNTQELKEAERHFMTTHTVIGAELMAKSNIPQLRIAEEIARCHHEWWNGAGYPSKLGGKRIPIHARIVALADVFDALTHGRPYAEPWPIDKAIEEIRNRRGTQFDPDLTDHFLKLIERLRVEHLDLDAYLGKAGRNSPFLQARNKIRLMLAEEREHERKATVSGNETRH